MFEDEEDGYNLDEETKYKLKLDSPDEPGFGGEPMPDEPAPDAGFDDEPSDKPFDDEPFDAGVEADETEDPEKYIQQLAGKLGTSLRKYTEDVGSPDFDLEKFAINSLISATHTSEMDAEDQKDIIKKIKSSGGEDLDVDVDVDVNGGDAEEEPFDDSEEVEEGNDKNFEDDENFGPDENMWESDLENSEIISSFNENADMKEELTETTEPTTQPSQPIVIPETKPSPRRKRIWEAKPKVNPKPKGTDEE